MLITPNQTFRHGKEQYEPETEYDVPDALGFYFVSNGWCASWAEVPEDLASHMPTPPEPATEPVTLDVQDVRQSMSNEVH